MTKIQILSLSFFHHFHGALLSLSLLFADCPLSSGLFPPLLTVCVQSAITTCCMVSPSFIELLDFLHSFGELLHLMDGCMKTLIGLCPFKFVSEEEEETGSDFTSELHKCSSASTCLTLFLRLPLAFCVPQRVSFTSSVFFVDCSNTWFILCVPKCSECFPLVCKSCMGSSEFISSCCLISWLFCNIGKSDLCDCKQSPSAPESFLPGFTQGAFRSFRFPPPWQLPSLSWWWGTGSSPLSVSSCLPSASTPECDRRSSSLSSFCSGCLLTFLYMRR